MKTINERFNFTRARNAEHYQLHSDILAVLTEEFAEEMGFKKLRKAYADLYLVERTCHLNSTAYRETVDIAALDRKRDNYFLFSSQTITTAELSPDEEIAAAGRFLAFELRKYIDAPRLNYAQNTANIDDFLEKMKEPQNAAAAAKLGLTSTLVALENANNEFNTVYTQRTDEELVRATSETMTSVRPKVDDMARQNFSIMNSLYEVSLIITEDEEKCAALAVVMDRINALLLRLQKTLSREGVGTGNSDPEPSEDIPTDETPGDDTTTPDSGETPGGSDSGTPDDGSTPGGSETPDSGDTGGNEGGGGTPTPPPGDDDDEEVVG